MFVYHVSRLKLKQPKSKSFYGRTCFTTLQNTEKRVENSTSSGVFLTKFEVFGNVVKRRCLELRKKMDNNEELRSKHRNGDDFLCLKLMSLRSYVT